MTLASKMLRGHAMLLLTFALITAAGCSSDKTNEEKTPERATQAYDEPAQQAGETEADQADFGQGEGMDGQDGPSMTESGATQPPQTAAPGVKLPDPSTRRQAPDFTLKDLAGKEVRLSDFRGSVVMVNFWATWCTPCRMEVPDFIKLQREYGPRGLQIIGVSLDTNGSRVVPPFARQFGVNYTLLLDGTAIPAQFGGIIGVPTTFLLDRQGRIVHRLDGYNPLPVFVGLTEALLAED